MDGLPSNLREIIASLMHSSFYFQLPLPERLALVKRLAYGQKPGPGSKHGEKGSLPPTSWRRSAVRAGNSPRSR